MDTKLKKYEGWTSRLPVKIICTAAIPLMMVAAIYSSSKVMQIQNKRADLLISDFNSSDYFFDYYVRDAERDAMKVFLMRSEENIMSLRCLVWSEDSHTYYDEDEKMITVKGYSLKSTVEDTTYSYIVTDTQSQEAQQIAADAAASQIRDFKALKNFLDSSYGFSYFVTDGYTQAGNVPAGTSADFFRSQPVYLLAERGSAEMSRTSFEYDSEMYDRDLTLYIAFSEDAVAIQNSLWRGAQNQLIFNLAVILITTASGLACGLIILLGAGRRYNADGGIIHFMFADRIWLDAGFIVLVLYELIIGAFIAELITGSAYYSSTPMMLIVSAALSVLFSLPLVGWASSFARHFKAGKWQKHTFIYRLTAKLHRSLESLWAGVSLSLKAFLISGAVFAASILLMFSEPSEAVLAVSFLVFVLVLTVLLKYFRRLFLVDQAAKKASEGHYENDISVNGGSLGSIAASVSRISESINTAVSESLKSERFKTELITNVSHDIRTPLTSLITYSDLLRSEGLDSLRAPEYLEVIIQKSARLKALTDDLFEASKAFSGNIEVRTENLDLADFVRQVLGEMDERVSVSGLDFRLDLPDHAPVLADGKLLWRVMENLLSNVFKYAMKDSRVYIDIVPEDGRYRLNIKNISDQPLNVDPSELLERFRRGDDSRSSDGSGLGLSIAQNFIESQGGQLEISIDGDLFKASFCLDAQQ